MDPRGTPGHRTHLAFTNLRHIDLEELEAGDCARIGTARYALGGATYLDTPGSTSDWLVEGVCFAPAMGAGARVLRKPMSTRSQLRFVRCIRIRRQS